MLGVFSSFNFFLIFDFFKFSDQLSLQDRKFLFIRVLLQNVFCNSIIDIQCNAEVF